jgi:(2R)-ethylmalonyl-CoA mutase
MRWAARAGGVLRARRERRATPRGFSAPTRATRARRRRTPCSGRGLAAGQTGLSRSRSTCRRSVATTPITSWRAPEVGKVGVPVSQLDDMHALFDGLPLEQMNTSMTINGTAAWLLALYLALAEERGVRSAALRGTTQNDIIKEYLARGTYIFPPGPPATSSPRPTSCVSTEVPEVEPDPTCAATTCRRPGPTPVQEVAFALANAIGGARPPARARPPRSGAFARACRPHELLRQRRHAVRRGDVQDARVRRSCGTS